MKIKIFDWEKRQRKLEWHIWFAWHPVAIDADRDGYIVWLKDIERKYSYGWKYRFIKKV